MAGSCAKRLLEPGVTLVYGVAGAGKTALAIYAAELVCRRGAHALYISTEGLDFLKRMDQVGVDPGCVLVREAYDLADLVEAVGEAEALVSDTEVGVVIVDSVNAPYRTEVEVAEGFDTTKAFMYVVAALRALYLHAGVPVILTAQVHEVDGVLEPVGMKLIAAWVDNVAVVEREAPGLRRLRLAGGLECRFRIHGGGLEWLS